MTKLIHCELTNEFLVKLLHLPETTRIIDASMHGDHIVFKITDDTLHGEAVRVKYTRDERKSKRGEMITEIKAEFVTDGDN